MNYLTYKFKKRILLNLNEEKTLSPIEVLGKNIKAKKNEYINKKNLLQNNENAIMKKNTNYNNGNIPNNDNIYKNHNKYYDMVYIINLKKNKTNKLKSLIQLKNNNFKNYKLVDACDGKNKYYSKLYQSVTKNMTEEDITFNFQKGALGCLLSHIECINDAKKNNYKTILILEDDFIIIDNYNEEITSLFNNIDNKWDMIYLGKKQIGEIDNNDNYYVYSPNNKTYGTHALLIKNTLFDSILNITNKIVNPIDISLQKIYSNFIFYALRKDLFISDDSSSDIQIGGIRKDIWTWNYNLYKNIEIVHIKNCIIYGFKNNFHHTHHYMHAMYYSHIKFYYPMINVYFLDEHDITEANKELFDNCIVICSPAHVKYDKYYYGKNTYYIFHLDHNDNCGYKTIEGFFEDEKNKILLDNINNYSVLLCREQITSLNYFESNIKNKQICLPWFSKEMYSDLITLKENINIYYEKLNNKKYFAYIGSIWNCNFKIIEKLIDICIKKKIYLLLKGRIFGISEENKDKIINNNSEFIKFVRFDYNDDTKNSFTYIDENYGIKCLLPIQGHEHIENYITNRVFESVSKGYIAITNSALAKKYFTTSIYNSDVDLLIDNISYILKNSKLYCNIMETQVDEFIKKFYSYNIINFNFNFLNDIAKSKDQLLTFDNNININMRNKIYTLWFCANDEYENNYFYNITKNNDIIENLKNPDRNLLIQTCHFKILDIFLIEQLIKVYNYEIYIDPDFFKAEYIINICETYNASYQIKNKLMINCLLSGQRTGSTLIIDVLQKTSKNVLALSEIFYFYHGIETYTQTNDSCDKNGILYGGCIEKFTGENIVDYFKQFEDLAIFQNKKIFLFKLTLDFNIPFVRYFKFDDILEFISKSNINIIYLNRDEFDMYVSKHLAEKYSYRNIVYEKIPEKIFTYKNYETLKLIKNDFETKYIHNNYFKNKILVFYDTLIKGFLPENINSLLNYLNKTNNEYVNCNDYRIFSANDDKYYNIKQNLFSKNELLDKKYWI